MSLTGTAYRGVVHPLRGYRGGSRLLRGIGRGARRAIRARRPRVQARSWCCCCPLVFALGLAGVSLIGGSFYFGLRVLGWA